MVESSDYGAGGPGGASPFCPYIAMNVAKSGGTARHSPYQNGLVTPAMRERHARQEADDAFGREAQSVRGEAAHSRERAARQVFDPEREQRDDQADEQPDVTVELVVHDLRRESRAR